MLVEGGEGSSVKEEDVDDACCWRSEERSSTVTVPHLSPSRALFPFHRRGHLIEDAQWKVARLSLDVVDS